MSVGQLYVLDERDIHIKLECALPLRTRRGAPRIITVLLRLRIRRSHVARPVQIVSDQKDEIKNQPQIKTEQIQNTKKITTICLLLAVGVAHTPRSLLPRACVCVRNFVVRKLLKFYF